VANRAGSDGLADNLGGVDSWLGGESSWRGAGWADWRRRGDAGDWGLSWTRWCNGGTRWDRSDKSTVVGNVSSADTNEVRSSSRDLVTVR